MFQNRPLNFLNRIFMWSSSTNSGYKYINITSKNSTHLNESKKRLFEVAKNCTFPPMDLKFD